MSKLRTALVVAASLATAGSSFASDAGPGLLGASVDLGGGIISSVGGATVARSTSGKDGEWIVTFKRDLTGCVWTGSLGYGRFRGTWIPGFIAVSGAFGTTNALLVQTFNGKSRASQDAPFTVTVVCG